MHLSNDLFPPVHPSPAGRRCRLAASAALLTLLVGCSGDLTVHRQAVTSGAYEAYAVRRPDRPGDLTPPPVKADLDLGRSTATLRLRAAGSTHAQTRRLVPLPANEAHLDCRAGRTMLRLDAFAASGPLSIAGLELVRPIVVATCGGGFQLAERGTRASSRGVYFAARPTPP